MFFFREINILDRLLTYFGFYTWLFWRKQMMLVPTKPGILPRTSFRVSLATSIDPLSVRALAHASNGAFDCRHYMRQSVEATLRNCTSSKYRIEAIEISGTRNERRTGFVGPIAHFSSSTSSQKRQRLKRDTPRAVR